MLAVVVSRTGGSPILTVRISDGTHMVLDGRGRTEAEAVWSGSYDEHTLAVLKTCLEAGDNLLDVGANVGLIAVPMARHLQATGGRVIAVEPVPANAERIKRSAALNGVDIRVIE